MKKQAIFWVLCFIGIFLLSQEYLWGRFEATTGLWGLPPWVYWFMGVHVLFIVAFYWFSRSYWKN